MNLVNECAPYIRLRRRSKPPSFVRCLASNSGNYNYPSTMAEPLSLSLQAFPPVDKEKESLEYLIRRVNNQRGSFRNITEQSLEEEIRELDTGGENEEQEDVVATVEAGEDAKTKKEEVSKAREEILKHVG